MTNPGYTHYIMVIDRSGSMWKIKDDAQGGIRQYAKDQGELPGKATLSFYQFDDTHEKVHDFAPLSAVASYVLVPRGSTSLRDAVGYAVTGEGERLAAMPEEDRPGKVVVLIVTDGKENTSHEYSQEQVKAIVTLQQDDYGWQFTYIGANVDAFEQGGSIGIPLASSMNYTADSYGTASAYASASAATTRYVGGQSASIFYTDTERTDAVGKEE